MPSTKSSVSKAINSALAKWREGKASAGPGIPYVLANAEINYEKGELVGSAQVSAKQKGITTNGLSIYVLPPGPGNVIYCGGIVGPPEGGAISLSLPISAMTSSTATTLTKPTDMTLLMIVVYNGSSTCTLSQNFKVGP